MLRRNVLVIDGRKIIGGGQIVTKLICDVLSEDNEVSVFIPAGETPVADYLKDYQQFGYHLYDYSRGRKKIKDYFLFVLNFFSISFSLIQVLRKDKFDLLYIQSQNILPVILFVNFFFRVKTISHLHVVHTDSAAHWLLNRCLRNRTIKCVLGVSNYTLTQLDTPNLNKSVVLYNSVPLGEKRRHEKYSYQLAIVGDVIGNKGHQVLFEALAKDNTSRYVLHVIGKVADVDFCRMLKEKYQSNVNFIFTGMLHNVSDYLLKSRIDLVIVPSVVTETFSLAMVESWGYGIPTIATNNFGMKELVNSFLPEYSDKMLFRMNDSDELFLKIQELESDRELYTMISDKVYSVAIEYFSKGAFSRSLKQIVSAI